MKVNAPRAAALWPLFASSSLALMACGCGAGPSLIGAAPIANYSASNVFLAAGFSERQIDETHYEVTATGTAWTPRDRIERIAMTRAAEIGVDNNLKFFHVTDTRHAMKCTKQRELYRGTKVLAERYPIVTVAVEYANGQTPPDPTWQISKDALPVLRADLDASVATAEATAAIQAEVIEKCGQGS